VLRFNIFSHKKLVTSSAIKMHRLITRDLTSIYENIQLKLWMKKKKSFFSIKIKFYSSCDRDIEMKVRILIHSYYFIEYLPTCFTHYTLCTQLLNSQMSTLNHIVDFFLFFINCIQFFFAFCISWTTTHIKHYIIWVYSGHVLPYKKI
jgi:hypothetical protein